MRFETGQVMKSKYTVPLGNLDTAQLYDSHLLFFAIVAQIRYHFGLIKTGREWESVDKSSPAASSQMEELELSRF